MRVFVTGGAGYIGSQTAKALAQAGHEPIVFDNFSSGHRWAAKWGPVVEGDLENADLVRKTLRETRAEAVIHFSASIAVGESVANPRRYFWNNVVNSLRLLDAMLAVDLKPIVFSSSAAVYGDPESNPIPEEHPNLPVNPYGETKLLIERALKWYGAAYGIKWAALRYFNAAGADPDGELGEDHHPETHLIPLIIQAALGRRETVDVFGTDYPTPDGTAIRDYIHVSDLAEAHIRALQYLLGGGESVALNLGTGKGHSVREVITTVERVSGKRVPARNAPRRAGDSPTLVARAEKAVKVLAWRPRLSDLESVVRTAWEWHSAHSDSD